MLLIYPTRLVTFIGSLFSSFCLSWALDGDLPFLDADKETEIIRGSAKYHTQARSLSDLDKLESNLIAFYTREFQVSIPPLNPLPILVKLFRRLLLPRNLVSPHS